MKMGDQSSEHNPWIANSRAPKTLGTTDLSVLFAHIGEYIERETVQLRRGAHGGFEEILARKQRGLMDIWALVGDGRRGLSADGRAALVDLKQKLDENAKTLRAHVQASRQIAGLLRDAARDDESDGTYSARLAIRR